MAKLKVAGSYINDHAPTSIVVNNLTEDQIRGMVHHFLGIRTYELEHDNQDAMGSHFLMNKCFADLGDAGDKGRYALYNHDGRYSLRTYTPGEKHSG